LVDLLERLEALLSDVRDVMERQSSLQGLHFPAPSMTIFKYLKGCEVTLQPLSNTIKKLESSTSRVSPAVASLKSGIRSGLKAKEIAGFETRIEREINYLQAALGTNTTAIL
jgi:hypothetical protein